jgi:hypothetical protein
MKGFVRSLVSAAVIGTAVSTQASATCIPPGLFINSIVNTGPTWVYNYSVRNGCETGGFLTDVFLPYFSDAGISSITFPDDDTSMYPGSTVSWSAIIQPENNLFGLAGAGAIDFHVTVTPELSFSPGTPLPGVSGGYFSDGFSFTSLYDAVDGPGAAEIAKPDGSNSFIFIDPAIPGSPATIKALATAPTTTPEPATLSLLATGLVGMGVVIRKRRSA